MSALDYWRPSWEDRYEAYSPGTQCAWRGKPHPEFTYCLICEAP